MGERPSIGRSTKVWMGLVWEVLGFVQQEVRLMSIPIVKKSRQIG